MTHIDTTPTDIRKELANAPAEPLLPVEKKLILWSFGTGVFLLVALTLISRV
jgi:hypothetical protein